MKGLIDNSNSPVRGYLLLIRKDFVTYMHDLAVYMKKGRSCARGCSL